MSRVHILSKKTIYIKLKIFLCVFHPIHEYFELSYEPVTLVVLSTTKTRNLENFLTDSSFLLQYVKCLICFQKLGTELL